MARREKLEVKVALRPKSLPTPDVVGRSPLLPSFPSEAPIPLHAICPATEGRKERERESRQQEKAPQKKEEEKGKKAVY